MCSELKDGYCSIWRCLSAGCVAFVHRSVTEGLKMKSVGGEPATLWSLKPYVAFVFFFFSLSLGFFSGNTD